MEGYTTAHVIKSIAATIAPFVLVPAFTALVCAIFPNLPKNILR